MFAQRRIISHHSRVYRDFKANVELHVTNTGIAIKMTNQVNNPSQTSRLYYHQPTT